jgi:hypothetical protein
MWYIIYEYIEYIYVNKMIFKKLINRNWYIDSLRKCWFK